jgi:hypothetical protein
MTCNDASSCQKACKHIQLCVSYLRIEHMCILKSQIRVVFVKCCSRASLRGSFAKSALRVPVAVLSAPYARSNTWPDTAGSGEYSIRENKHVRGSFDRGFGPEPKGNWRPAHPATRPSMRWQATHVGERPPQRRVPTQAPHTTTCTHEAAQLSISVCGIIVARDPMNSSSLGPWMSPNHINFI